MMILIIRIAMMIIMINVGNDDYNGTDNDINKGNSNVDNNHDNNKPSIIVGLITKMIMTKMMIKNK